MNGREAMNEAKRLTDELLSSAKQLAEKKQWSVPKAIDYQVEVRQKFCEKESAKAAWGIRGEKAKQIYKTELELESKKKFNIEARVSISIFTEIEARNRKEAIKIAERLPINEFSTEGGKTELTLVSIN